MADTEVGRLTPQEIKTRDKLQEKMLVAVAEADVKKRRYEMATSAFWDSLGLKHNFSRLTGDHYIRNNKIYRIELEAVAPPQA